MVQSEVFAGGCGGMYTWWLIFSWWTWWYTSILVVNIHHLGYFGGLGLKTEQLPLLPYLRKGVVITSFHRFTVSECKIAMSSLIPPQDKGHRTAFISPPRLADFKQVLTKAGIQVCD